VFLLQEAQHRVPDEMVWGWVHRHGASSSSLIRHHTLDREPVEATTALQGRRSRSIDVAASHRIYPVVFAFASGKQIRAWRMRMEALRRATVAVVTSNDSAGGTVQESWWKRAASMDGRSDSNIEGSSRSRVLRGNLGPTWRPNAALPVAASPNAESSWGMITGPGTYRTQWDVILGATAPIGTIGGVKITAFGDLIVPVMAVDSANRAAPVLNSRAIRIGIVALF
jgi:hypothetical protein